MTVIFNFQFSIFNFPLSKVVRRLSQSVYELIALGARYVFSALMVLIVARAWRNTVIDSRKAETLRRFSPETGLSGELVVIDGDEQARRGMKYPVIREGLIGSSRRADIRIRHSSVRRRHATFQLTERGLSVRAIDGAPLYDGRWHETDALILPDGGTLIVGEVRLMLVLAEGNCYRSEDADIFFDTNPVLRHRGQSGGED